MYARKGDGGGLRFLKAFMFFSTGRFLSLVTSIPTNCTLDPNNLNLRSLSVHRNFLRVSATMSKYAIMTSYVSAARKTPFVMFEFFVFSNGNGSYLR